MDIRLNWTDPNDEPVITRVYVSDIPINREDLPEFTAELEAGVTEYLITDAVPDQTYYVVLEVIGATDSFVTHAREVVAELNTGPGPQDILYGDWDCGYFGTLDPYTFLSTQDITPGWYQGAILEKYPVWHKLAYRGKVIYSPQGPVRYNVEWNELYDAGMVYGMDGPGPGLTTQSPVDQNFQVYYEGHRFSVRLPEYTVGESTTRANTDWQNLICRLDNQVSSYQPGGNFANLKDADYGAAVNTTSQDILSRDLKSDNPGLVHTLGKTYYNNERLLIDAQDTQSVAAGGLWWPILELLPVLNGGQ